MIAIIDLGIGNKNSIKNVLDKLDAQNQIISTTSKLTHAEKIIICGVGSFDHAMKNLNSSGMRDEIENKVFIEKVPVLGICLGMQLMTSRSEEGVLKGLNWVDAVTRKFDKFIRAKVPHIGWNNVVETKKNCLSKNCSDAKFYFLHSFFTELENNEFEILQTHYVHTFTSGFKKDNIYGVQFHPEKSLTNGKNLLKNFINL